MLYVGYVNIFEYALACQNNALCLQNLWKSVYYCSFLADVAQLG